jgi:hypothetical protein
MGGKERKIHKTIKGKKDKVRKKNRDIRKHIGERERESEKERERESEKERE